MSNQEYLCEGLTMVGMIKVTLNRKPYTNKYIIRAKGLRNQETQVLRGFNVAHSYYLEVIKAIKENPFTDINKIPNE